MLNWFPEREIYLRSQGRVRFVRISPQVQFALVTALTLGFGIWLCMSLLALIAHWQRDTERESLQQRATQIRLEDGNLRRNRRQYDDRTRALESRQRQLENIVRRYLGMALPRPPAPRPDQHSSRAPIDQRLASIEHQQLGFAAEVVRSASTQDMKHRATLKLLGLSVPQGEDARGGPFIPYDGPMPVASGRVPDALFAALQDSLGQWQASRRFMTALPAGLPVTSMDLTSAFGVRADPFTHRRALHPGQDFRGAVGGPIMAAGVGKVIHAGWLAGYGKAVMIDHGYHLVSLYGHMSRIFVQDGQAVRRGEPVGLIGSTGRSTGPHLHFEVRLNGRSINPWPLMEMNLVR